MESVGGMIWNSWRYEGESVGGMDMKQLEV